MNLRLKIKKTHINKCAALFMASFVLTNHCLLAALSAPTVPMPPSSLPVYAQNPKSVRRGPMTLRPVVAKALPEHPTDLDVITARIFEEPLIPMTGSAIQLENDELSKAIRAFKKTNGFEDTSALTSFIRQFPKSRWTPSLQLNVGLLKFQCGYISQALELWLAAWNVSKNEKGPMQKAIADRAIAEVLQLDAKIGRMSDIEVVLAEIQGRAFQGSTEQKVRATREALTQMHSRPDKSFKCGPYAVSAILAAKAGKELFNKIIDDYPSTNNGTSLEENRLLAEKVGVKLQIAKRAPGANVIVPSVIHWKLGHFAAITAKTGNRYEIKDPTFGITSAKFTSSVFDTETDGYALVPEGALPSGWAKVSKEEGAKIFGRGVPWIWPDNMGHGAGSGPPGCSLGMMQVSLNTATCNLHLVDTPLSYQCPIGNTIGFEVDYNYLTADQPAIFTFTNLGPNWSFEYLSYLTLDASSTATIRLPEGYSEVFALSGGTYKPNKLSQAVFANLGGGTYQRQLPDGSIMQYDLSDASTPARIFMTKIFDPQGNQTLIQYDCYFRITSITDCIGEVSTVTYVSNILGNSGFYKISSISDPFSRTCSFTYDSSNTNLVSTTDVIGLQSEMFYDPTQSFVNALRTPYGTTSFSQYTPAPSGYPTRGLRINYPDGTIKVVETWFGHEPYNATFIWDREAMQRYPNDAINHDFTHCYKIAWLWSNSDGYLWPIVDYIKPALENRITLTYLDEQSGTAGRGIVGTNTINKPIKISRPAATPVKAIIAGTKTTGDVLTLTFTDTALITGSQSVSYTVLPADSLSTIASGLAAAVNANNNLQALGVTAASAGTEIAMISQSANQTIYTKSTNGGATETITLGTPYPQSAQITLSGAATAGQFISLYLIDQGVSQGSAAYTILSGDTLATAATALRNAINASSIFTSRGIVATSYGPTIFVSTSSTPNNLGFFPYFSSTPSMSLDYQSVGNEITYNFQNNAIGHKTFSADPAGRVFSYTYAANGIDLTQITEVQNNDSFMIGHWTYNSQHRPIQYVDGSAQTWTRSYNAKGQITSESDPNSDSTTYTYSGTGSAFLTQIEGPLSGAADILTFTYDGSNRLATETDSEGYQLAYSYDNADRLVKTTYPDGTTEQTFFERLDAVFSKDRDDRWSQASFDSLDQLSCEIDPLGRKTTYDWCSCGALARLTDGAGNITTWHHDLEGRLVEKKYANQTTAKFAYSNGAGRLLSRLDALNQLTNYFPNSDGTDFARGYQNQINKTSSVIKSYDNKFPRLVSAQNDWGNISYSYNAYVASPGSSPINGGGRIQLVHNDVIANSDISFVYDNLGRVTNRSIDGASNSTSWAYDQISRVTSEQNILGTFGYTYVDNTPGSSKGSLRLASFGYPNSQTSNYDWYGNSGDQRLKSIDNVSPSGSQLSRFDYQYNPSAEITQWQQQQNGSNYFHNFKYDLAGQLISDQVGSGAPHAPFSKEFYYAYDKAANRIGVQSHSVDTLRVSGTVTSSDTLSLTVKDSALTGGQEVVNYVVQGGDTLSTIAQNIATAINTNTDLQAIGVAANAQAGKTFVNIRAASSNITTYSTSVSGGATETLSMGIWRNGLENAVIGGTKTTSDVITLTFKDIALSGGTRNVAYTVQAGDTLTSIATNIAAAINADTPLQNLGVSATSVGTVISIISNSVNVTSYTYSLSVGATETVALSINPNETKTATIGGTKTTSDTLTVTVYDSALGGGSQGVTYTVQSGDTLSSIATGVAGAINGNGNLQAIGVSASASGKVVTINSKSINATTYRATTSGSATETITVSVPMEAWTVAAIGGTKTTGNVLTITTYDSGLSGGKKAVGYTVQGGDTLTSIATNLAAAINADTDLQGIGVSATSSSTVVSLKSTSPNLTTFAQSLSAGATETIVLSASTSVVRSTFNNVNELVSIAPGGKIRFQGSTSKPVASAKVSGQVLSISQSALKGVTFDTSVDGTPTETLTLGTNLDGNITATVGGTVTPGDVLSITVNDVRFRYGPVTCSYTVKSGDTTGTIAQGLNNAIYNQLGYGGTLYTSIALYFPSYSGSVVTINPNNYYADVIYTKAVTGVATETLTSSANFNGNSTVTVGGTATVGDVVSLTVENVNLPGGEETVSYTVVGGNTPTNIATSLKNAINASSNLAAIGVTATSSAAVVTITTEGTTYTTSTSGGATETLTLGTNANGNTTLVVGGKATNGDTVTVVTHNPLLPGGQESVGYTVGASDTLVDVAAGLATNMNANSDLQGLGVTAKNSCAADLAFSQSFSGNGNLPYGESLANVSATDAVPTTKTDTNSLNVTASSSSSLTWDANGNMTSDGTNTYKWDAENRLVEIDYPGSGNSSQFYFDGFGRQAKIVEKAGGSIVSTKQFVWSRYRRCEVRDGSSAVLIQYSAFGQKMSGVAYFYSLDHQSSVREMTDSSGVIQASYQFDAFGQVEKIKGSQDSDFLYAGYYFHSPSGLYLTTARAYSPSLGRFISRDPIGESGGINLYAYCEGNPVSRKDPSGTSSLVEFDIFKFLCRIFPGLCHPNCAPSTTGGATTGNTTANNTDDTDDSTTGTSGTAGTGDSGDSGDNDDTDTTDNDGSSTGGTNNTTTTSTNSDGTTGGGPRRPRPKPVKKDKPWRERRTKPNGYRTKAKEQKTIDNIADIRDWNLLEPWKKRTFIDKLHTRGYVEALEWLESVEGIRKGPPEP